MAERASSGETLMPPGERYEVLKTLGRGAYGIVALARDKETGEKVRAGQLHRATLGHSTPSQVSISSC